MCTFRHLFSEKICQQSHAIDIIDWEWNQRGESRDCAAKPFLALARAKAKRIWRAVCFTSPWGKEPRNQHVATTEHVATIFPGSGRNDDQWSPGGSNLWNPYFGWPSMRWPLNIFSGLWLLLLPQPHCLGTFSKWITIFWPILPTQCPTAYV